MADHSPIDAIGNPIPDLTGFTCIARGQSVGDGFYCAHKRDLYENGKGDRVSVAVTPWRELETRRTWENKISKRSSVQR